MRYLMSLVAAAALVCFSTPAHAINFKSMVKHATHPHIAGAFAKISAKGQASLKNLGNNLFKHVHGAGNFAKLNPQQLEQHALAEAKKMFPKANPEQLHHAAAMAMHHATDLLHNEFQKFFPGNKHNPAAKITQAAHDALHKAHDLFDNGIKGMMSKFKAPNVGNIFKGLF